MRQSWSVTSALCLVLGMAGPLRADEKPDVKTLVDQAIKAAGGEANLTQFKAATWKGKGTFYGLGEGISYTGAWSIQAPEQARITTHGEFNGEKFQRVLVINGDKGWTQLNDTTSDMDADALAEEKERLFANWVATLVPLLNKGAELTPLGETKINGQAGTGLQVTVAGHRPVKLYFDNQSHLLVKWQTSIKNIHGGREQTQEVFYGDYKDFQGLKRATKITVKVDNQLYANGDVSGFKPREKLAESVFARP